MGHLPSDTYSEFLKFIEYMNSLSKSNSIFEFTGNLGATNNYFGSRKIKNSIKLAGIKNTLKKIKTLVSVMLKNKSKNEKIRFESTNLAIVVQDNCFKHIHLSVL